MEALPGGCGPLEAPRQSASTAARSGMVSDSMLSTTATGRPPANANVEPVARASHAAMGSGSSGSRALGVQPSAGSVASHACVLPLPGGPSSSVTALVRREADTACAQSSTIPLPPTPSLHLSWNP